MQSGAFWDTVLRNVTLCALTSSHLDDFSDIVTYIWNDSNILFWGGGGAGKLLPLKYQWMSQYLSWLWGLNIGDWVTKSKVKFFFWSNTLSHVNNISALDKIIIIIIIIIIIHCDCMDGYGYFCRHAGFCFFLAGFSSQSTYDPGLVQLTVFITYCMFIAQTIPQIFYTPTTKSISLWADTSCFKLLLHWI